VVFAKPGGSQFTKAEFISRVRSALARLGLPANSYAGHSFRRGGATVAGQLGLSEPAVKLLGRWRSDSYLRYVDLGVDNRLTWAKKLVDRGTRGVGVLCPDAGVRASGPPAAIELYGQYHGHFHR
jgi:hypothetical protein